MPTRGILYYTDNCLNMRLARVCRDYIAAAGLPITSVTLKPTAFGRNIVIDAERSYKTLFRQIETGLATMTEDVVYFCEHDVLYHASHFAYMPDDPQTFCYNGHYWMVRLKDGYAVRYDVSPLSGLVVHRAAALRHFRERNAMIAQKGFGYWMGFEPFTHHRVTWEYWCPYTVFMSEWPNVDLTHNGNLTQKRFSQQRFIRKPSYWLESDEAHIPGWPDLPQITRRLREA
jgi:hypothetical protein